MSILEETTLYIGYYESMQWSNCRTDIVVQKLKAYIEELRWAFRLERNVEVIHITIMTVGSDFKFVPMI